MATSNAIPLSGLARRLVRDGLINEEDAQEAYQAANQEGIPFVSYLANNNLAETQLIAEAAADEFGTPLLDFAAFDKSLIPKDLVDSALISKHHTLPLFQRSNRLFIAVSDPTNLRALDEIKFNTGINTDAVLVDEGLLASAIQAYLDEAESMDGGGLGDLEDAGLEDLDVEAVSEDGADDDGSDGADDTPIVRFVNKVLVDAIKMGASDIHFEPYEKSYRVRFRTDGILHEVHQAANETWLDV